MSLSVSLSLSLPPFRLILLLRESEPLFLGPFNRMAARLLTEEEAAELEEASPLSPRLQGLPSKILGVGFAGSFIRDIT